MAERGGGPSLGARWTVLVLAMAWPTALTWLYFVALADAPARWQQAAYGLGKLLQFGLPLLWVLLVERRPLTRPRPDRRGLAEGLAFGLLVAAGVWALYRFVLLPSAAMAPLAEAAAEKAAGFGLGGPLAFLALACFYSLAHSGLEEYYWRWFVFGRLRGLVPMRAALVLSSLAFAAHHVLLLRTYFGNGAWTLLLSACVAIGGAYWAWLYARSRSLLGPWLSHALVDAALFAVGWAVLGAA